MTAQRKYVRIYYDVIDDAKFAGIYDDDRCFATWVRLLLLADSMWPAPADIPRNANPKAVSLLTLAGLLDLAPNHRYRIHGMDAERNARSIQASNAAGSRWAYAERMPSQDEQSQAEPSRDEQEHPAALDAYAQIVTRPSPKAQAWLDRLVATYGDGPTAKAVLDASKGGVRDLLSRTETLLQTDKAKASTSRRWAKSQSVLAEYREFIKPPEGVA